MAGLLGDVTADGRPSGHGGQQAFWMTQGWIFGHLLGILDPNSFMLTKVSIDKTDCIILIKHVYV